MAKTKTEKKSPTRKKRKTLGDLVDDIHEIKRRLPLTPADRRKADEARKRGPRLP